ncbi:hypothetical protein MKX07_006897 [Trichoderma sp. CBMAI-0711]|nr:hypothetical protein MKX07_006897 [Trichoderma sp. CBMAI-0711]
MGQLENIACGLLPLPTDFPFNNGWGLPGPLHPLNELAEQVKPFEAALGDHRRLAALLFRRLVLVALGELGLALPLVDAGDPRVADVDPRHLGRPVGRRRRQPREEVVHRLRQLPCVWDARVRIVQSRGLVKELDLALGTARVCAVLLHPFVHVKVGDTPYEM